MAEPGNMMNGSGGGQDAAALIDELISGLQTLKGMISGEETSEDPYGQQMGANQPAQGGGMNSTLKKLLGQ